MNKQEANTILSEVITEEGLCGCLIPEEGVDFIDYVKGDAIITLEGSFTPETLKALLWYIENE